MKIQTFKNLRGLIYGSNPKRIKCDKKGVLKIGTTEINIQSEKDEIVPLLFHGCSGEYAAEFTDENGKNYVLENVIIREGRIAPPSKTDMEIMELRCRAETLERENEALKQEIQELRNIFDTNSLNFLIN